MIDKISQNPKRWNDKKALEILKDGTTFWGIFCYSTILSLRILGEGWGRCLPFCFVLSIILAFRVSLQVSGSLRDCKHLFPLDGIPDSQVQSNPQAYICWDKERHHENKLSGLQKNACIRLTWTRIAWGLNIIRYI